MAADRRTPTPGSPTVEPGTNYAVSVNEEVAELYSHINCLLTGVAGTNDITATCTPPLDAYFPGQTYDLIPLNNNTGPVRLNIGNRGFKSVRDSFGAELQPDALLSGVYYTVADVGSVFRLRTDAAIRDKVDKSQITTSQASNSDTELWPTSAVRIFTNSVLVGITSGLNPKGNIDCSANPNYPAATKGDMYTVSAAGKIGGASGTTVQVGDFFYATVNNAGGTQAAVGSSWAVVGLGSLGQALLAAANIFTEMNSIVRAATGTYLRLRSTAVGSSITGPDIDLFRDGASANGNVGGAIHLKHRSSTSVERTFAGILSVCTDISNGAEYGALVLKSIINGVEGFRFRVGAGLYAEGLADKGAGTGHFLEVWENGVLLSEKPFITTWTGSEPVPARTPRSNKQRWSNTIWADQEMGADPSGTIMNYDTILYNAFQEAKARIVSEIRMPSGYLGLSNLSASICQLVGNAQAVRIIGNGNSTFLFKQPSPSSGSTSVTGTWIQVGDTSGTQTKNITFEGFRPIVLSPNTQVSGEVFWLINTVDIKFHDVQPISISTLAKLGYSTGPSGAIPPNPRYPANYTEFVDCAGTHNTAGKPMFNLVVGGILQVSGGSRWNGTGTTGNSLIAMANPSQWGNWDGLYVHHQFCEAFPKYLSSTGAGISNMQWIGGQTDRASVAFESKGDNDRHWDIFDLQMLNSVNPGLDPPETDLKHPFVCETKGTFTLRRLLISGYTGYIYVLPGASDATSPRVAISEITFEGCGKNVYTPDGIGGYDPPADGLELIRFGGRGDRIQNCRYISVSGLQAAKNGVNWQGFGGNGRRGEDGNNWVDLTGPNTIGTV